MPPIRKFSDHLERLQKAAAERGGVASGPPRPKEVTTEVPAPVKHVPSTLTGEVPFRRTVPVRDKQMESELPELIVGELGSQYLSLVRPALRLARYAKIEIKPDRIDCWDDDFHFWITKEGDEWVPNDRLFGRSDGRTLEMAAHIKMGKKLPVPEHVLSGIAESMRYESPE